MKRALIALGLGYVLVFTSLSATAATQDVCELQSAALAGPPPSSKDLLPIRELSEEAVDALGKRRACAKSYAMQLYAAPDLEALVSASVPELRANLDVLRNHFDGKGVVSTEADSYRQKYIKAGWQREQVILWGSYLMLRKAYQEGDFNVVRSETARLRQEFDMKATKIASWDRLEEATYFSAPVLKNMILGLDYAARIRRPGLAEADAEQIRGSYLKDRPALQPFARQAFNPDSVMFRSVCAGK